jgi:hypothetical protein
MKRRKSNQFNAPPIGGPLPRPATGSQQLANVMSPLIDPPGKFLKKLSKEYEEGSPEYDCAYVEWYSDRIHEISNRITFLWKRLDHEDRCAILGGMPEGMKLIDFRSKYNDGGKTFVTDETAEELKRRVKSYDDDEGRIAAKMHMNEKPRLSENGKRLFTKMLNDHDSMSIWLTKSQRQFTGHPLVATHQDIIGYLKNKIDPSIAHEDWESVFFKHSPFIEVRFFDSHLPSLLIGTQHDKVNQTSLTVIADNYNNKNSYCMKFSEPDELERFLAGQSYIRSMSYLETPKSLDAWHYPESSGGSHNKAELTDDGMVLPYLDNTTLETLTEAIKRRGLDPDPLQDWWDGMLKGKTDLDRLDGDEGIHFSPASKSLNVKMKEEVNEVMRGIAKDSDELDSIISEAFPHGTMMEQEKDCPIGKSTQEEIRQTLWVTLSILLDASRDIITITEPRESSEGSTDTDGDTKEYVPPRYRWKIVPKRTRLSVKSGGATGEGTPKPAHHRKQHTVTFRHERYRKSGLMDTTKNRGVGGISIKGYEGPIPEEVLSYAPSKEEREKIEKVMDADRKKRGVVRATIVPREDDKPTKTHGTKEEVKVTPRQHKERERERKQKVTKRAMKAGIPTTVWSRLVEAVRSIFRS